MTKATEDLNILIVDDSETDTQLMLHEIRRSGIRAHYQRVETSDDFKQALLSDHWDVILCDYIMPHFSEPAAIKILRENKQDIPFVVISGKIGEDVAVETMKAGASDYILKDNMTRLVPAIQREVADAREREKKRSAERALELFIEALTHDLKTPLLAESSILKSLYGDVFGPVSDQVRDIVKELLNSNHYVLHMLNNILDSYKYKEQRIGLKKAPVNLNETFQKLAASAAIKSIINENTASLSLDLAPNLPTVELDENAIIRVVENLLKNAAEHTPRDGEIRLYTKTIDRSIRFGVQDNGSGIAEEIKPYLFQAYTNASVRKLREVSVGLGLYLCKLIVEAHGGTIQFQSLPNQGSDFYIDLPL